MPRFRILAGIHVQDDPHKMECDRCKHRWNSAKASHTQAPKEVCPTCKSIDTRFQDKVYRAVQDHKAGTITCDVFDSRTDLGRLNAPGFTPKFELVSRDTPLFCAADGHVPAEESERPYRPGSNWEETVKSMNADELRKHAADEEIDVSKAKTKDELVKAILGAAVKAQQQSIPFAKEDAPMAARTTPDAVIDTLRNGSEGGDYDDDNEPSLDGYIDAASAIVDRVYTCSVKKNLTLSTAELELIERWLAAHMYCMSDQTYASKNTTQASASFKGQTGMGLDITNYGQMAKRVDYSGCLTAIDKRQFAGVSWLGKPPSQQISYDQRS